MLRTSLLDGSDAPTCRNGDSLKQRHTFVQCHSNNALLDHKTASHRCKSTQYASLKVLPPTWHKIGHFGDIPKPISWLGMEKLNLTQQKHAFSNQKKCTTTQNKHKTSSSAAAKRLREPLSQLKSCQLLHNCTKNHIWLEGLPFHVV